MAHSKQVSKYVEEILECSVCLDVVKDPHTLQTCFHSYCKECIDQLIQKQNNHPPGVKCPVCRNFSGKDEIRNNFFIKDLAQMHRSTQTVERGKMLCDQCKDEIDSDQPSWKCYLQKSSITSAQAEGHAKKLCQQCKDEIDSDDPSWKCLDCKVILCDRCKRGHLNLKLLQGHRVIPITEDTEDVVDQLVFCSIHADKPIELYCKPCKLPLCMTCKVTDHDGHTTKTTQKILEELVPEMKENIKAVDKHIHAHAKSIKDVDTKILEVKEAFLTCHKQVDKTAEERISEIKAAQKQLKVQLNQQEENELKRLKEIKDNLDKKQKEGENLKRVVLTSLDKARHATLLTELVQGGLHDKVKAIKDHKQDQIPCKISLPKVEVNSQAWNKMKETGLLGKLVFDVISILIIIGSGIKATLSGARYWSNTLQEYFVKPWKKILEIKLNGVCTRVALIRDQVWAPVYDKNCIEIYSKTGQLIKSININKPFSIEQSYNKGIFVASQSGLYIMTENDTPVNVCEGSFSDICCFKDKIYVLEYKQKVILEYCHDNDVSETQPEKWKQTRKIQLNNYESTSYWDKLLVTNHGHDVGPLYFCVSSRNKHTIYKYNEQGQQIRKYGGPSEEGEAQLSYPLLCGIDSQSNILVADQGHNKYKILDPEIGQWRDTGLNGETCVYDSKIDSDGFLWLSQHNVNKPIITKHQQ